MGSTISYLAFNEVGVTIACLAGAFTFIVLTWNAIKALKEWIASLREPTNERLAEGETVLKDHEERISTMEHCCVEVQNGLTMDREFQKSEIEMNKLMLRAIKQLLKHELDGNDVKGLGNMADEIDTYLVAHLL